MNCFGRRWPKCEPCVVRFFSVEEAKNGIRKQALFSTLWGCEPSGGYFCEITGNGWFTGPALSSKSCKKAVKSSISRPFLVETKRIEFVWVKIGTCFPVFCCVVQAGDV